MFGASCPPTQKKNPSLYLELKLAIENNHIQTNKDVNAFFLRKKYIL